MKKGSKSVIQFAILLSLGSLLVWLALRQVSSKKEDIYAAFKSVDYTWVFLSMGIAFLSHFLRAYRWNFLLNPLGYKSDLVTANGAVFIGYFANYGLPRMGELSRCTIVNRYNKIPFETALGTVITERIIDLLVLIVVFVLTIFVQLNQLKALLNQYIFQPLKTKLHALYDHPVMLIVFIVIILLVSFVIYFFRKKINNLLKGKIGGILKGFTSGLTSVKEIKHKFLFIVLSISIWGLYLLSNYVCFFAFKGTSHLGLSEALVLLLFGTFGVLFTPGGLGAYHAIVTSVLVFYSIEQATAFAYPWITWTSQFVLVVILGSISLIALPLINKSKKDVVSQ